MRLSATETNAIIGKFPDEKNLESAAGLFDFFGASTHNSHRHTVPRLSHILLAEDNEDDVFLLRQALRRVNDAAVLHTVPDGAEAVAWLKGTGRYADRKTYPVPDVLLLDLNMPRLNGFEVLTWVRADPQWNQLMVHVMTASSRDSDVQQAYGLRANSYVVKPTRLDELVEFVSALHHWHTFVCLPPGRRVAAANGAPAIEAKRAPVGIA